MATAEARQLNIKVCNVDLPSFTIEMVKLNTNMLPGLSLLPLQANARINIW